MASRPSTAGRDAAICGELDIRCDRSGNWDCCNWDWDWGIRSRSSSLCVSKLCCRITSSSCSSSLSLPDGAAWNLKFIGSAQTVGQFKDSNCMRWDHLTVRILQGPVVNYVPTGVNFTFGARSPSRYGVVCSSAGSAVPCLRSTSQSQRSSQSCDGGVYYHQQPAGLIT
jgi:hypothetical protein